MPDPIGYEVSYSFSGWQTINPSRPLPATPLDIELANIEAALGSLRSGLLDLRRSDGQIENGVVSYDSLSDGLKALLDGDTRILTSDLHPSLFATALQAEAGVASDVLMTPLRTFQAIDARIATEAQVAAGTADDVLMTPLGVLQAVRANRGAGVFVNLAAVQAEVFGASPPATIVVLAHGNVGARGGGVYRLVSVDPTHAAKVVSADGRIYELAEAVATPEMRGASGAGTSGTDDTIAVQQIIAYCNATGAVADFPSRLGYAISAPLTFASSSRTWQGRPGIVTFHALHPTARIDINRVAQATLRDIVVSGKHPTTGEIIGVNGFVAPFTGLPGVNTLTLDNCGVRDTRGASVRILRDATEFRVLEGEYLRAGRVDGSQTGAARFPDGHVPNFEIAGNGTMSNVTMSGATGFNIEVYGGGDDDIGVWEEVHVRAVNVRAQNGFLGILRVRGWSGPTLTPQTRAATPVQVVWHNGYMENPGTIQDSTTTGGGAVTQGSSDDVVAVLVEGDQARLAIDAPVRINARRASALLRARDGGRIVADFRDTKAASQALGNANQVRVLYDADASSFIARRSEPEVHGAVTDGALQKGWGGWTGIALTPAHLGPPVGVQPAGDATVVAQLFQTPPATVAVTSIAPFAPGGAEPTRARVTATAHGFANGEVVRFTDLPAEGDDLTGFYIVAEAAANTFELRLPDGSTVFRSGEPDVGTGGFVGRTPINAVPGGGTPAQWAAVNGVSAVDLTTPAVAAPIGGSGVTITCRATGSPTPSFVHVPLDIPADRVGLKHDLVIRAQGQQVGGTWSSPRVALALFDPLKHDGSTLAASQTPDLTAVCFPTVQIQEPVTLPSPGGAGNLTPVATARVVFVPLRAGRVLARVYADTNSALHDEQVHFTGTLYARGLTASGAEPADAATLAAASIQGAAGAPGQGVPPGGTTAQVLTKIDGTDYNTRWETPAAGGGGGDGDVVGPASAVSGHLVTFSGTSGKVISGSGIPASTVLVDGDVGVTVQPLDAGLTSIAGITIAADQMLIGTGPDTYATAPLTPAGRALLDDANAAAQRATLELGTLATQAAGAVAITGGSITGITDLAVADGGTGASTAAGAQTNLGLVIGTDVMAQGDHFSTDSETVIAEGSTRFAPIGVITKYGNVSLAGGDGVKGVILPAPILGRTISVTNSFAGMVKVYPHAGGRIESASQNTPYEVGPGVRVEFRCIDLTPLATNWTARAQAPYITFTQTLPGLVPPPGAGAGERYVGADGVWRTIPSGGSVALADVVGAGDVAGMNEADVAAARAGTADRPISADVAYSAMAEVALSPVSTTLTPNFHAGRVFAVAMAGNYNLAAATNRVSGQHGMFIFTQDATGGRTLSLATEYKTPAGSLELSTAAGAVDAVSYYVRPDLTVLLTVAKDFR